MPCGQVSPQAAIEGFSQLAQSHFINQAAAHDTAVPGPVRKTLNALGAFVKEVFRRAQGLRKMKQDGRLDPDLEAALEKSTGINDPQVLDTYRRQAQAQLSRTGTLAEQPNYAIGRSIFGRLKGWFQKDEPPPQDTSKAEASLDPDQEQPSEAPPLAPPNLERPPFIVEKDPQPDTVHHETEDSQGVSTGTSASRYPRVALELRQRVDSGRDAGADTRELGGERRGEGEAGASASGAGLRDAVRRGDEESSLPELDPAKLAAGLRALERKSGDEHDAYFDEKNGTVTKLTRPGFAGDTDEYLRRLATANEVFDDHIRVEGRVQVPGEGQERIVTTQPLIRGRRSTLGELAAYMRAKGFQKAMDGVWHRDKGDLWVGDLLEKNAITDERGKVHIIDFTLPKLSDAAEERYLNMLHGQPQPEPPPLTGHTYSIAPLPGPFEKGKSDSFHDPNGPPESKEAPAPPVTPSHSAGDTMPAHDAPSPTTSHPEASQDAHGPGVPLGLSVPEQSVQSPQKAPPAGAEASSGPGSAGLQVPEYPDPRILEAFGPDYPLDEFKLPELPEVLPKGDPRLIPTADKKNVFLGADHPLVVNKALQAGEVSRENLKKALVSYLLTQVTPLPEGVKPTITVMGGGGGAGKGSILKDLGDRGEVDTRHAVPVNSDDIKNYIPEYEDLKSLGDGRAASVTQRESNQIADYLLEKLADPASQKRHDVIYDATLANKEATLRRFAKWKKAGFDVRLVGVSTDPYEALVRASLRAQKEGRWVPNSNLLSAHQGFNAALPAYLEALDHASVYENSTEEAHLLAHKAPNLEKPFESEDLKRILEERSHNPMSDSRPNPYDAIIRYLANRPDDWLEEADEKERVIGKLKWGNANPMARQISAEIHAKYEKRRAERKQAAEAQKAEGADKVADDAQSAE